MQFPVIILKDDSWPQVGVLIHSVDEFPIKKRFKILMENANEDNLSGVNCVFQHDVEEDDPDLDDIPF